MFERIDKIMDSLVAQGIPGVDIQIYHRGKEVYRSFKGYSDIENKIPMNGQELYNLYSASKPITSTAALQLTEKGDLSLDAPLYDYIPEFREMYVKSENGIVKAKNAIKIRDLFCMTAGFSYDTNSPSIQLARKETNGSCPTVETIKYLAREPLEFEPGTKWNYSLCHDTLAAVVEVASGMRFGEYVRKNIFEPLGMKNSTFLLPTERLNEISAQYRYNQETKEYKKCSNEIQIFKLGSEYESGGAGGISTVEDYSKFNEALRQGNTILRAETIKKMHTDIICTVDGSGYWPSQQGYGYGLGVKCAPPDNCEITDFGWGGAAGACQAVDIENEFTLFFGMHVLGTAVGDGHSEIVRAARDDIKEMLR